MGKKSKKTGALGNTGQGQLADAFKALRTAQGTIEALQKAQQAAAEEVRLASTAVHQAKQSEHQGRSTETYGEERYWENRYKSDATGCHSSQEVLYEWYLPYSDLRLLLKPELDRFGGSSARLLIPGCGNSSLCEDLALDGFTRVVGMDYSPTVINTMGRRCQDMPATRGRIRYFCGDARSMTSEGDGTYDVAIDKGTLDAIVSDDSGGAGLVSGVRYLQETWRVLSGSGRMLLLSTMNPPVLCQLFDVAGSSSEGQCMWNLSGANMAALKTKEGRDIFFYSFPRNERYSYRQAGTVAPPCDSMLVEIARIKEEAAAAVVALQTAQAELEKSRKLKDERENSLKETNQRVEHLQGTLDKSWGAVSAGIATVGDAGEEMNSGPSESIEAPVLTPALAVNWREEEILDRAVAMPEWVRLVAAINEDTCVTQRHVTVTYTMLAPPGLPVDKAGLFEAWDEDDTIALEAVAPGIPLTALYTSEVAEQYESFEYTLAPTQSGNGVAVGTLRMPLPPYGGWFVLSYTRQVVNVHENAEQNEASNKGEKNSRFTVTRVRTRLAQCEPFQLQSAIFQCRPDLSLPGGKSVRRRGAGSVRAVHTTPLRAFTTTTSSMILYSTPVLQWRGDRKGLEITLSAAYTDAPNRVCLCRILSWAYSDNTTFCSDNDGLKIVVEVDVVTISVRDRTVSGTHTACWVVSVPSERILNVAAGTGCVDIEDGIVRLWIPELVYGGSAMENADEERDEIGLSEAGLSVNCAFCGAELLPDLSCAKDDGEWPEFRGPSIPLAAMFAQSPRRFPVTTASVSCVILGHADAVYFRVLQFILIPSTVSVGESLGDSPYHQLSCTRCWNPVGDISMSDGGATGFLSGPSVAICTEGNKLAAVHPVCSMGRAIRLLPLQSRLMIRLMGGDEEDVLYVEVVDTNCRVNLTKEDIQYILGVTADGTRLLFYSGVLIRCSYIQPSGSISLRAVYVTFFDYMKIKRGFESAARCLSAANLQSEAYLSFVPDI